MTKRITAMSFKENAMTSKRNEQDDQNQELQGGMNVTIGTRKLQGIVNKKIKTINFTEEQAKQLGPRVETWWVKKGRRK
jgi:hypothetical protein